MDGPSFGPEVWRAALGRSVAIGVCVLLGCAALSTVARRVIDQGPSEALPLVPDCESERTLAMAREYMFGSGDGMVRPPATWWVTRLCTSACPVPFPDATIAAVVPNGSVRCIHGTLWPSTPQARGAATRTAICVDMWVSPASDALICGRAYVDRGEQHFAWPPLSVLSAHRTQERGVRISGLFPAPPPYGVLASFLAWRGVRAWQELDQCNELRFWCLTAVGGRRSTMETWPEWRFQLCGLRKASMRGEPIEPEKYVASEGSVTGMSGEYVGGQMIAGPLDILNGAYP